MDALAGDIAGDRDVLGLAADLVDLVNVDDAALGAGDVEVGGLQQAQDDVFHVLADVAGFGERGGVHDAERHVEHAGERAGEQRFSGTCRAEKHDVRLLDLHVLELVTDLGLVLAEALIVIVNGDREHLFGVFLTDDVLVELGKDGGRGGNLETGFFRRGFAFGRSAAEFLFENVGANLDALVADIHTGTGDQFFNLRMALSAEGAHRQI